MDQVFEIVLPIFGIMLLGFLGARMKWFDESAARGLARFVFDFAIPVLMIRSLSQAVLFEHSAWHYLAAYFGATIVVFVLGWGIAWWKKRSFSERVVHAFISSFANTVLMGIPVVMLTYGDKAVLPLFIIVGVHSMAMMPSFTILLEIGKGMEASLHKVLSGILKGIFTNPIILGVFTGIMLNLSRLRLWQPLDSIAELLGNAVTPCALFALGAGLARFSRDIQWREVSLLALLKTAIHPLLAWLLAAWIFGIEDRIWLGVLVLLAAMPAGVNPFLFASRYGVGIAAASSGVFVSTAVSLITLTVILNLLQI